MTVGSGQGRGPLGALVLALGLAALPTATYGQARGPLLEALAYVPAEGVAVLDFSDRVGLRQASADQGLDRQAGWPRGWGLDYDDLAWRLRMSGARDAAVLRLGEGWDPESLVTHLERHGFVRQDGDPYDGSGLGDPIVITFVPGAQAWYEPDAELERVLGRIPATSAEPGVGVTIMVDDSTVIVERGGSGGELAVSALERDPADVAESPFGRVAASLDGALEARIVARELVCSGSGAENGLLRGRSARLAHSVGRLRPYQAVGVGYGPGDGDGPALGRYVFEYERPVQARRDLQGRRTLIERGDGLVLAGAEVDDRALRLDVAPEDGDPAKLIRRLRGPSGDEDPGADPLFAICGPLASPQPPPLRHTTDVPLFAGPATLTLSGGDGVYAWDEVRFGAQELDVRSTVSAGREPCGVLLTARQAQPASSRKGGPAAMAGAPGGAGHRLAEGGFAAAPGETATGRSSIEVDYATAALRVDSSCEAWSLRLVPVKDPELPWTLAERFYPVRGATIAEIVPQTAYVDDTWAAYSRWDTTWQFAWEESETACDVTSGSARLRADIIYPRWRPPAHADGAAVSRWRRFMRSLTTHELGHITIALQGAAAIDEALDSGFSAPTCEQAERLANRSARRVHDRFNRLNVRYDRKTDHGAAQGTDLR